MLKIGQFNPSNVTPVAPAKSVPVIVTKLPPPIGPDDGLIEVTVGAGTPVPCIEKRYGFSSVSLFAMLIAAERVPAALGLNVIWNVVEPLVAATGVVGIPVTAKSAACVPKIVTNGEAPVRFNAPDPVF